MRVGSTPEFLASFWTPRFDGKLPRDLAFAEPLEGHTIELEGHELVVVELGHTALDTIESLHPQSVIAGHQRAGRHDGPEIIEETRQYIRDFDRIAQRTSTAQELYDQVLALHPDRINPDALRLSAQAVKPSPSPQTR